MKAVKVALMEFVEGGNTIWVQSRKGTVLRIKCSGRVSTRAGCSNLCPHADINVTGDIEICIPK